MDHNSDTDNTFFVKVKNKLLKIDQEEIYLIKAIGDYVAIHTINQKYIVHSTMKNIMSQLPTTDFIRVHQSYIVRLDKINVINRENCVVNNEEVPISKAERKNLLSRISIIGT